MTKTSSLSQLFKLISANMKHLYLVLKLFHPLAPFFNLWQWSAQRLWQWAGCARPVSLVPGQASLFCCPGSQEKVFFPSLPEVLHIPSRSQMDSGREAVETHLGSSAKYLAFFCKKFQQPGACHISLDFKEQSVLQEEEQQSDGFACCQTWRHSSFLPDTVTDAAMQSPTRSCSRIFS